MQGFNMGKYVPPEHEGTSSGNRLHKKHALGARAAKLRTEGILVVRFEVPYAIWCATCPQPTVIGQGVRFNAEKRRAGQYYTTPIWSFRFRHAACGGTIEMRTDPQNTAYVVVSGATRRDTGDDKNAELEGGVPILTDAERQALRSNAFASLEKTINDRAQLREASQRIDGLMDVAARQWEDPYALNQKLRRAFRAGRKEREVSAAATGALQDRMSLGMDLLPETEEDARRARLVDFAPGEEDREAALSKPLFETAAPKETKNGGSKTTEGVAKEARRKMQMRESFATQVMGNTRAAKDPFLLTGSPGTKRAAEGKPARIPGIKRKRDAASAEDTDAPSKTLNRSSGALKGTALVEYDSD